MLRRVFVFSLGLSLSLGWALPQERVFHVDDTKAQWKAEGGREICRLTAEIPGFGRATFSQSAGETLRFSLYQDHALFEGTTLKAESRAAVWEANPNLRCWGTFLCDPGIGF